MSQPQPFLKKIRISQMEKMIESRVIVQNCLRNDYMHSECIHQEKIEYLLAETKNCFNMVQRSNIVNNGRFPVKRHIFSSCLPQHARVIHTDWTNNLRLDFPNNSPHHEWELLLNAARTLTVNHFSFFIILLWNE